MEVKWKLILLPRSTEVNTPWKYVASMEVHVSMQASMDIFHVNNFPWDGCLHASTEVAFICSLDAF